MREEKRYELKVLSDMMHVNICYFASDETDNSFTLPETGGEKNYDLSRIISVNETDMVMNSLPVIRQEQENIYLGILPVKEEGYLIIGPIITTASGFSQKWKYLHEHKIKKDEEIHIPHMRFSVFIQLMTVITCIVTEDKVTVEQIIEHNQLRQSIESERKSEIDTEEVIHHTYSSERAWTEVMRAGDGEEAKKLVGSMIGIMGKLSEDPLTNSKYVYISVVTLATRIAMENGVPPAAAYDTSDKLINQMDRCRSEKAVWDEMYKMIDKFSELITRVNSRKKYSGYVEQCKYYIDQNYRKNLSLEELSDYTGVNSAYLSHLFSQMEGVTLKEYLNKVRVERAQNLLKYSDRSIIEIGDYVGFQSQSYFGRIFKKYTGKTPGKYRSLYKMKEFGNNDG